MGSGGWGWGRRGKGLEHQGGQNKLWRERERGREREGERERERERRAPHALEEARLEVMPPMSTIAHSVVMGLPASLLAAAYRGTICTSFCHVWYSISLLMSVCTAKGVRGGKHNGRRT